MRQRLPLAISVAALVVALLGATSLGEAARNGVASGVTKAKRATGLGAAKQTARRGPRGPRGYRGPRGFQGPPGEKGEPGLPNGYEFKTATQTPVTGSTPETATLVAAPQTGLPDGKYSVTAQLTLEGTGGRTSCRARGPGPAGPYLGQPAWAAPGSGPATLTLALAVDLPAGGTVNVACWQAGGGALAGPVDLVAVKIGDLTALS